MKVIITGGTGMIGGALARSLVKDGHTVIVPSRNPEAHRQTVPEGIQLVEWDAQTAKGWGTHVDGAEAIVNLAGASIDSRWTDMHRKRILNSRVNAGTAVTEAIKAADRKPGVLIQSSAVGYYGPCRDEIITEDSSAGRDFLAGVCKEWEASTQAVEEMGVRRCVIRSGIILSRRGGVMKRLLPIFKLGGGGTVGSGKQYYPWIHIGDEVDAIRFLIDSKKASGVFNLSAPEPVRNKEFTKALGKALSRPTLFPAPAIPMRIVFGEMATIILDGQRAIPQHLQEAGYQFRFTELESAFRHLLYSGVEK